MKTTYDTAVQNGTAASEPYGNTRGRSWLVLLILLAAVAASAFGFRALRRAPVKKAAPMEARMATGGRIAQILVKPGEHVRKGQLLAVLDTQGYEQMLEGAQADLAGAELAASTTAVAVAQPPTPIDSKAAISGRFEKRAVPVLVPPMATPRARNNAPLKVNLKPDKPSVQSDLPPASPSLPAPQASNTVAAADVKRAQDSKNQAMGRIQEVMTKIDEAKSEVAAQQALVDAAQSSVERTKADKDKSATLLAEGVISANEASRAESYYAQATGQLEQAKAKASEAQALVGQYERELDNARKNLKQSESKFQRAQIEAKNPRPVQRVAHSSASPFSGMVAKNMPTQPQVKYKLVPMKGPIIPAPPPIPTPVHVDLMAPQKAGIAIEQAKAAVALAEQNFAKCCIYAPTDGTVVRVLVAPGQNGLARQPVILIEKS